ncbi:MAG: GNAT family N-acetyltransferase [Chloroflexota bacterium]
MTITIRAENPHSDISKKLVEALSADLGARYDDDGAGAFSPDDVTVDRAIFLVAFLDDEAVGCGALRLYGEDTAEIKRMYVAPSARRKGIARQLLSALEDYAVDYAYQRIILETGTRQPEAIRLYDRAGYQRMACYGQYADDPLSVCYEKVISTD